MGGWECAYVVAWVIKPAGHSLEVLGRQWEMLGWCTVKKAVIDSSKDILNRVLKYLIAVVVLSGEMAFATLTI